MLIRTLSHDFFVARQPFPYNMRREAFDLETSAEHAARFSRQNYNPRNRRLHRSCEMIVIAVELSYNRYN